VEEVLRGGEPFARIEESEERGPMDSKEILSRLGLAAGGPALGGHDGRAGFSSGRERELISPVDGRAIARFRSASPADAARAAAAAREAFPAWRDTPAPRRGELVARIALELRRLKQPLASLVSLEAGKILSESEGEVQEMIDIAEFAAGLSRQLYGLTMHSERPGHRLYEQYHPLGAVAVITAFNFPVAVWAWNAMLAAVCGDTVVWKPSEKTPLSALAAHAIASRVAEEMGHPGLFTLSAGEAEVGRALAEDPGLPLVSATGSCRMGRAVAQAVARRLGRSLLELGGNNAAIVLADADFDLALRAVAFGAAGTAGQRCTTIRRLIVEAPAAEEFTGRLVQAYRSLSERIGNPFERRTLVGPLIDRAALEGFHAALARIKAEGGEVLSGGRVVEPGNLPAECRGGFYVEPTLVRAPRELPIAREETFAPILYLFTARDLEEAIAIQNGVSQGLSSAIFTRSLQSAELFLSARGSDCGIANVNVGTSGAEIGGAFGGEKDSGGGREAGSDAWKAYMRRQTCTINWSRELPLAQGVEFNLE
jgi:aldehyde dehydrogenase (NAD+)